jgi:hypothetical protein
MSKDEEYPFHWPVDENNKRVADQTAALLGLSDGGHAIGRGLGIVFAHARAHARGKTEIAFCTPEVKALIENNPKFIEALCEEGVVEWLTPFVLTKSKLSTIDTNQP